MLKDIVSIKNATIAVYERDRSHGTLCFWILKASFLHQCPSKPTFEDDSEPTTVLIKLCPVFSASRTGGELPEGVVPHPNGTLDFGRPLSPSDGGTYTCVAKNDVGEGKAEVEVSVAGRWQCFQRPALRLFRVTHGTKKKKMLISSLSTVQRVSHSPKSWRTCWWSWWVRWPEGCWSSCSSLSSPSPATISAGTRNWRRSWQRRGMSVEHNVGFKGLFHTPFGPTCFSNRSEWNSLAHFIIYRMF